MSDTFYGWYFSNEAECLLNGDGRKIEVGVTHTVDCKPILCKSGLHASKHILDALNYAPGPILWLVSLGGTVEHGDDKSCATERTYHARLEATDVLRAFSRKCALQVIHIWNAPSAVREYLETGNEELRAEARAAAWVAHHRATWPDARESDVVACGTARATGSAAWAAEDPASAYVASASAAWAAEASARAAWATEADAWASARDAQRDMLEQMVVEAMTTGKDLDRARAILTRMGVKL